MTGLEALRPENERLLAELEPFVVAAPWTLARLDTSPFGLRVADDALVDPLRRAATPLLAMLQRLDAATFGAEGMPMPRWLFLDGAELPGAIVGFARRAADAPAAARALLGAPAGHDGLVPYSMYIAVPSFEEGAWMGHNLASLRERLPDEPLRGLGGLTKAVALKVLRASAQIGATQWASRALHVHARMGALELLTAWTPAHSEPASLTYRAPLHDSALRRLACDRSMPALAHALPDGRPPDSWIDSDDHAAMEALQERIEAGGRFCVIGRPAPIAGARQRVPIAEV